MASACIERDLICVTDEVYEHLVFDGEHVPLATLPGMAERTLTISSIGKSFSVTGWKIGWCSGPATLVAAARTVKQYLTFAGGTPLQHAAAVALGLPPPFLDPLRESLRARRDQLCAGLAAAGLSLVPPAGTFFVNADVGTDAAEFCRTLPERCGVVAIPTSVFYDDKDGGEHARPVRVLQAGVRDRAGRGAARRDPIGAEATSCRRASRAASSRSACRAWA